MSIVVMGMEMPVTGTNYVVAEGVYGDKYLKSLISSIPPADVRPAIEINDAVDEAIRILNAINTSGRLNYGDYCELHDAICSIWIRGENNAEMG